MSSHQLFALVIGIDNYQSPSIDNLKGAVADADAINQWLQDDLRVPPHRIINLRNTKATRENIIDSFYKLRDNDEIKCDDPILIYFAGHGTEVDAPDGWQAGRDKIEAIVPSDTHTAVSGGTKTYPLPDRTICGLLNDLADHKGNNITVVFDCCHSASATRNDNDPDSMDRRVTLDIDLPSSIDQNIIETHARHIDTPKAFAKRDLRSHVLLAACGAEESARETRGRGRFTTKFLEMVRIDGVDKLTYTRLIEALPIIPSQNPQCEGYYKDRFFFNGKVPGRNPAFIRIVRTGATYTLKAGLAHGILNGAEFTVHADPTIIPKKNPVLCRMRVATTPMALDAELEELCKTHCDLPEIIYGLQVRCAEGQALKVHCTHALMNVLDDGAVKRTLNAGFNPEIGFSLTRAKDAQFVMDLDISGKDRKATFSITHPLANQHGLQLLPYHVPPKDEYISNVLHSASLWHWHIRRENDVSDQVQLKFTKLEQAQGRFGAGPWKPVGDNLNEKGIVKLVLDKNDNYGVEIVNYSDPPQDLFAYAFWFDSDQRINPLYRGASGAGRVHPTLRAGSSFTIGYGAPGISPLHFYLHDNENVDVGFLKVFITTEHSDFGSLNSESPFINKSRHMGSSRDVRAATETAHWGTLLTTVIVKRQ